MKYDAFISYRHAPLDMEMAKLIHTELEKYKVPRSVRLSSGKNKINRVFRDQEELPIGNNLSENITSAIAESEFLIVVCSKRTRESEWVTREIETFEKEHGRNNILAVLVDGTSSESFPPALLVDVNGNPAEPLAADIRGETPRERRKKLKTEILRLAAPILYCSYDDLRQRHRERKIKSISALICAVTGVIALAGVAFAVYNARMADKIKENYNLSLMNQSRYLADTSQTLLEEGDRETAVILAMDALGEFNDEERPYVAQAEYALSNALYSYNTGEEISKDRIFTHELPVLNLRYDASHKYIVSHDEGYSVYLWSVDDNNLVAKIPARISDTGFLIEPLAYTYVNDEIIVCSEDGVFGYDLQGNLSWSEELEYISGVTLINNDTYAVCASLDRAIVFDFISHQAKYSIEIPEPFFLLGREVDYKAETNTLLISGSNSEEKYSLAVLYDLSNGRLLNCLKLKNNCVCDLKLCDKGNVVALTYDYDEVMKAVGGTYNMDIEYVDSLTGSVIWSVKNECSDLGLMGTKTILKVRTIEDDTVASKRQTIVSRNNDVFVYSTDTGEEISHTISSGMIEELLVSAVSSFGYLGNKNGQIDIADLSQGVVYTENRIDTGYSLQDMIIADGVVAVRKYKSPDILLLRYISGKSMETLISSEQRIADVYVSSDEKYFAVWEHADATYYGEVKFYDKSGAYISTADTSGVDTEYMSYRGFVEKGKFLIIDMTGNASLIDPKTGKREAFDQPGLPGTTITERHTQDGNYIVLHSSNEVMVLDTDGKREIFNYEEDGHIADAIVSEDGRTLYILTDNKGLRVVDIKSGADKRVPDEKLSVFNMMKDHELMCINADGSRLAMCTADGYIRIVDTDSWEIVSETACKGFKDIYMEYVSGGTKLLYQSDDMYINIMDAETGTKLYVSDCQMNNIQYCRETGDGKLVIITTSGMLILETNTYSPVAYAEKGVMYLSKDDSIVSCSGNDIVRFKCLSVEELKKEAREQFPQMEMSEEIRLKYHIN